MVTWFLEEIITLMPQSLSQTGIKRKYNVLGKLSHICFTGSVFLLSLRRSISSGHCWKGRHFPLTPQPWHFRLLTYSLRQEDSGNSYSFVIHVSSRLKKRGGGTRRYRELPLYAWAPRACMEDTRGREPFCSAHQALGHTGTGIRPPVIANCRIRCPRG